MAISKERKNELVAQYQGMIEDSEALFLAAYGGMSVKDMQALRVKVREANGQFLVTKNTLMQYALDESDHPDTSELLQGQLASSFALGEAPTLAKALVDFAKADENFEIMGGIMDNNLLSQAQVEALANLPTLDQLRAQILGLISAPARDIASTLSSGVRQVVNVVDAYANSEDAQAEAA